MKNRSYLSKVIAKSRRRIRGKRRHLTTQLDLAKRKLPSHLGTVTGNIRFFSEPGPHFEDAEAALSNNEATALARVIAFYLPQFHRFPENDQWWGAGFTEWRNVVRGAPRFAGHYQPRIPRDLGFYDLTDDHTLEAQAQLAKANGVDAFCFYYYWFDGKRLLERPLDRFLESDIDHSFCIMWANENWTRTWDGKANDVLISQSYRTEQTIDFIRDTARYMKDPRYVRVQGRPLFILYRPALLPDARATLERWRILWNEELGVEPWILMVQCFGEEDPRQFGLDGAVEFPPHKVTANVPDIDKSLTVFDPEFKGLVMDYETVVKHSLSIPAPAFPLIKTASPTWDSDARRPGRGTTLHGSTPRLFETWMQGIIEFAQEHPFADEPMVFINAWNEWAEGAYLEPDVHNGHAYLNSMRRAVIQQNQSQPALLLVGHDAHANGAQMLLLNLARCFKEHFNLNVCVLLMKSGRLSDEYKALAPTHFLSGMGSEDDPLADVIKRFVEKHGFTHALCNTTVTGHMIPALKQSGVRVLSLIHEMPDYIRKADLASSAKDIATQADHIIFPADIVRVGFGSVTGIPLKQDTILPQGLYQWFSFDSQARQSIRAELGLDQNAKLIMNAGYADLRKGFDLFLQTALRQAENNEDLHFLWVGKMADDMRKLSERSLKNHPAASQIHLVGFSDRMRDYFSASDCLLLTSREDPYPSVVLEAMQIGLPVIVFQGTTGFDTVLNTLGFVVPVEDHEAINHAIDQALSGNTAKLRQTRADYVEQNCKLEHYCDRLLSLLYGGDDSNQGAADEEPDDERKSA